MIFITGHHNTGKSTTAKWLISYGFNHIETGEIVRQSYQDSNSNDSFYDWVSKKNIQNENYLNDLIVIKIINIFNQNINSNLIITGNRQITGINYIINKLNSIYKKKSLIIFLHAPEKELFDRQLKRKDRIIPNLNFDLFKNKYLAYDENMGINDIKKDANYIIDNSCNNILFKDQIIQILKDNYYL